MPDWCGLFHFLAKKLNMNSLHIAPIQGHTDVAYRHFHSDLYGGSNIYYSPFIRLEREVMRPRDIKDINSDLNANHNIVPQIIFRDEYELKTLIRQLKEFGFKKIDLNMGCPFPLQTGHGRGAATILNAPLAEKMVAAVKENPDIEFSVKMRLGLNDPKEWEKLLPYLNQIKLTHISLHPRIAKQQYGGEVNLNEFGNFLKNSSNPVIYNGDIKSPGDMHEIISQFPDIKGLMVGRGILARPSLFNEFSEGSEWVKEKRINKMLEFHRQLFEHYSNILCGEAQIIAKIKPFWEYAEEEIGRKPWKAIKKAVNISKYQTAVAMI